jgi:hypothetical protein
MEINGFKIKIYGVTELALVYNPDCLPKTAAWRLRCWIDHNRELNESLSRLGWKKGNRLFTPLQVEAIVRYLGEP